MVRLLVSVIAGYLVMVVLAVAGIVVAWNLLGPEGAFETGSTQVSTSWALINCFVGVVAALAGGWIAARIGADPWRSTKVLAGCILVLGLVLAFGRLLAEPESLPAGKSVSELSFFEAGDVAEPPIWYGFVIPILGAAGALAGGRLVRF